MKTVSLAVAVAMLGAGGCSQMPPASELFDLSPEAEGTGIVGTGLVRAVVIIAKHQASNRQRQVAEQNARAAQRRYAAAATAPPPVSATQTRRKRTASGEPKERDEASSKPASSKRTKKKLRRYIAVDTTPDARSKGDRSVMIWDTASEEIVGNNVYDIAAAPSLMETARFETYSAQYVGSGDL